MSPPVSVRNLVYKSSGVWYTYGRYDQESNTYISPNNAIIIAVDTCINLHVPEWTHTRTAVHMVCIKTLFCAACELECYLLYGDLLVE